MKEFILQIPDEIDIDSPFEILPVYTLGGVRVKGYFKIAQYNKESSTTLSETYIAGVGTIKEGFVYSVGGVGYVAKRVIPTANGCVVEWETREGFQAQQFKTRVPLPRTIPPFTETVPSRGAAPETVSLEEARRAAGILGLSWRDVVDSATAYEELMKQCGELPKPHKYFGRSCFNPPKKAPTFEKWVDRFYPVLRRMYNERHG